VSVLFCDLVGFTTFSETRDAEDVRDVLEHYFEAARGVVAAYGGTIEKFIGDAVMAVWGAPVALEDDAERSVRAALDLTAAVATLAQRLAIPELRLRGGILTGEAAVDVGAVQTGMVIGDAVNTAARIQSLAEPGTVLVDDTTRLATERSIAYEPAGIHAVKGKTATVRVWRATQVVSLRGGVGRSGAVEPPLVGRNAELGLIRDAVDALLAPDPGIEIVTVIGDAGLGKTRLVWEFEKYVDGIAARVRWLRGRALGFGEGAGFSALAEVVRMGAGIVLEDSPERQRAIVDGWIDDVFEAEPRERARVAKAVHRLLALDDGKELIEQGALFSSWRALFERLASREPVVLILEELHQADQGLCDFIAHVLEWAPDAAILVLALGRPHARLELLVARGERIELKPLSDDRMDELVSAIVRDAPESLLHAVRVEGGGVPLYAVETLRSLADSGVLSVEEGHYVVRGALGELAIPPTIRALVASRLDRLGHLERRLLAGGAVLGERFAADGAAALAGVDEADARTLLEGLVTKQLLSLETASRSPLRGRYCFLQGVVRRVLLSTLSHRVRRKYHLAVVEYLLRGAPEPELASVLASHLLAAAEMDPTAEDASAIRERAGVTLREAAERAAAVGALEQALSFFDRAVELATAEHEQATILERAGDVAHRSGASDAAAERYRLAGGVHAAAGRERERLGVRTHELRALRYVRAPAELLGELRELDAALGDRADERSVFAGGVLAFTLYQCGRPEEALAVARRAVDVAEICGVRREMLGPLGAQASSLAELERPEESIEVFRRALAIAEHHDQRIVASIAGNIAVSLASLGNYAEAAAQARDAIAAAQRTAERFSERWSRLVLGRALCSLGDWDEATAEIEAVRERVPPFQIGMAIAPLVVIALARGQTERVTELVAVHDRRCSDGGASVFESDFRAIRATVIAIETSNDEALAEIVPSATVADYAEWSGWLAPVVDRLVAGWASEPLRAALVALRAGGRMRRTAPVLAQAERLDAHLAARAGDDQRASECWARAEELSTQCGLRFESAVIALERGEHDGAGRDPVLASAVATFERLGAEPWLTRARQTLMSEETAPGC
jgi:class 3 adenylate cyclase/predicted ATPase